MKTGMRLAPVVLPFTLLGAAAFAWRASPQATVDYPEGYRTWAHVKSGLVGPDHSRFPTVGGFQHVYANAAALAGYRTRVFPEGSVVVFDWLELRDNGQSFEEGPRRQVDVMVKDSLRFGATGGWGFQRFTGDSRTQRAASPTPEQCFGCHRNLARDGLVISSYRP